MHIYLESNPYPAGGLQPIAFILTSADYPGPVLSPAFVNPDSSVKLRHEVTEFGTMPGTHTITVVARSYWGDASPVNFTFESGVPVSGLHLVREE